MKFIKHVSNRPGTGGCFHLNENYLSQLTIPQGLLPKNFEMEMMMYVGHGLFYMINSYVALK